MIISYLDAHFRVTGLDRPLTLIWVGKEVSHQAAWLYFEFAINGQPTDGSALVLNLENRILIDFEPTQKNLVLFRAGERRSSWTFTAASEAVELHWG